MLVPSFRVLPAALLLAASLSLTQGVAHADTVRSLTRDLQRALEPFGGAPSSAARGANAASRTADLPPVAGSFQSCASHFYRGQAPVVQAPSSGDAAASRYGTLRALCYDQFAVLYAGGLKGPLFSAERLTAEELREGADVKRPDGRKAFFPDARLPARERAQLDDYAGESRLPKTERHDRGHMQYPAKSVLKVTFAYRAA